jgi:hypothetical protein
MSAVGQKRRFGRYGPMSALHPKATAKADIVGGRGRGIGMGATPFFGGKAGQIAGMPCSCDCDWLGHLHDRRMGNARIRWLLCTTVNEPAEMTR